MDTPTNSARPAAGTYCRLWPRARPPRAPPETHTSRRSPRGAAWGREGAAESWRFSPNGSGGGEKQKGIRHDEVKQSEQVWSSVSSSLHAKTWHQTWLWLRPWPPFVRSSRGSYETTDSLHLLVRKIWLMALSINTQQRLIVHFHLEWKTRLGSLWFQGDSSLSEDFFFSPSLFFWMFSPTCWTIITSTTELSHSAGLTRWGRIPAETLGGSEGNFSKMMPSGLFLLDALLQGTETQRQTGNRGKPFCLKSKIISVLQSRECQMFILFAKT